MALGSRAVLAVAALVALPGAAHAAVIVEQGKKGLVITGDDASDRVDVQGLGAMGVVEVWVNSVFVDSFVGVADIKVKLSDGNDTLNVSGVHMGGNLIVDMGAGDDGFQLDDEPDLGAAPDHDAFIAGGLDVKMGGDAGDFLDIEGEAELGIIIGGDVILAQVREAELIGEGTNILAEREDVHIGGKLKVSSKNAAGAEVDLDDVNVGGATTIQLGSAEDGVQMTDSRLVGKASIVLGQEDDELDLDGGANTENAFHGGLVGQGGAGSDLLDDQPANIYTIPPSFSGFELIQ